ncbi:saccharopine dehydrogenase NADP-binding domain-containing protein [Desulfovibrio desulfuricans]|uniref:saccharopine dehydrogenase NADP-binding domain-containing protein n=1 Tax=Desulfovibrio desulfuricans TaxID=876 RepID=UPI001F2DE34F|nr:saccharopine dehydrogenase NADP-binding domain-containing protein [Desulfovibrio desulfuricans]UIA98851.1 saccharopine dehydrogenase NADP-binding domain-containing protein [Desulfovibrio desulfuricans]
MTKPAKIAVLGATGSVGRAACRELCAMGPYELVLCSRQSAKATHAAQGLNTATEQRVVDIFTAAPSIFQDCDLVLNCAGPSWQTGWAAANLAWNSGAHYVDVAGYSLLKQRLSPYAGQAQNQGRSMILTAGWIPGISEVFTRYALSTAEQIHGPAKELTLYCGARDHWSEGSVSDMIWHLFNDEHTGFGYLHKGRWTRLPFWKGSRRVAIPSLADRVQSALWVYSASTVPLALERPDISIRVGLILLSLRTRMTIAGIKTLLRKHRQRAQTWLCNAIGNDARRLGVQGLLRVQVSSRSGHIRKFELSTTENIHLTGMAGAAAAHMTLLGQTNPGVHFLGEAVSAPDFLSLLADRGVRYGEAQ